MVLAAFLTHLVEANFFANLRLHNLQTIFPKKEKMVLLDHENK
jgi:hypothetical protein